MKLVPSLGKLLVLHIDDREGCTIDRDLFWLGIKPEVFAPYLRLLRFHGFLKHLAP